MMFCALVSLDLRELSHWPHEFAPAPIPTTINSSAKAQCMTSADTAARMILFMEARLHAPVDCHTIAAFDYMPTTVNH